MNETPTAVLDQAAFERVWRRVMPQDRADCPFTLEDPGLTPTSHPQPLVPSVPAPAAVPAPPQSIPCLGEASTGELPALEALMERTALALSRYRALERRTGRRGSFSRLVREKDRQLRRLAAARFLISGQEHTAVAPQAPALPKSGPLALRELFRAEQLTAAALMDAAQATADPCLSQLYREQAEEDRGHADLLRERLERM